MSRRQVLLDWSSFSASIYVSQILQIGRGIIKAKLLGPSMMGLWSGLSLITTYSTYSHFGILDAVKILVPNLRGSGNTEKLERIRNTAVTFYLLPSLLITGFLLFYSFFSGQKSPEFRIGLIAIAILVILQLVHQLYYTLLRADMKFMVISKATFVLSIMNFILTFVLVYYLRIYGVFIVSVLFPLFYIFYYRLRLGYRMRYRIDWPACREMLSTGFPILGMAFFYGTLRSIDKIIILAMLGKTQLGYYSLAAMLSGFLSFLPGIAVEVLEPRLYQQHGAARDLQSVRSYLTEPLWILSHLTPPVLGVFYLFLPFFVLRFMSEFAPGVPAIRILVIGGFFAGLPMPTRGVIVAAGKQFKALLIFPIAIAVGVATAIALVHFGFGISGVAFGSVLMHFIYGLVLVIFAFRCIGDKTRDSLFTLLSNLVPFFYSLAMLLLAENLSRYLLPGESGWIRPLGATIFFLIATSPLLIRLQRHSQILGDITQLLRYVIVKKLGKKES